MTILLCVLPQAAGKQFRAPMGVPVRLLCELKAGIKEKSTSLPYLQGHYSNTGLPPLFIISGRRQRRHDDSFGVTRQRAGEAHDASKPTRYPSWQKLTVGST